MVRSRENLSWWRVAAVGLALVGGVCGQVDDPPSPAPLANKVRYLKPGEELTGSQGRVVRNTDSRKGGYRVCVWVATSARKATKTRPAIAKGEVMRVVVPLAQGTNALFVDSRGLPTSVVINKGPRGGGTSVAVLTDGGRVRLELNGDHASVTMGGQGNQVIMNGSHNRGQGLDPRSGGVVHYTNSGRHNAWSASPGSWASRS